MHQKTTKIVVKTLSIIIWGFYLSCAIKAGLDFTDLEETWKFKEPLLFSLQKLISTIFPFCVGLFFSVKVIKRQNKRTFIGKLVDKMLGDGFSNCFVKTLRFPVLGATFFLLIGCIGLTRAFIFGATEKAIFEILFPFSFGLGIAIPLIFQKLYHNKRADA